MCVCKSLKFYNIIIVAIYSVNYTLDKNNYGFHACKEMCRIGKNFYTFQNLPYLQTNMCREAL